MSFKDALQDKMNGISDKLDKASDPRAPEGRTAQKGSNFLDQSVADDSRARDLANTMVDSLTSVTSGGGGTPLDDLERATASAVRTSAHMVVALTTLASQEVKSIGSRTIQYGPTVLTAFLGIGALRHWASKHGTDVSTYEALDFSSKGGVQQAIFNERSKADFEMLQKSAISDISETTINRNLLSKQTLSSIKLCPSFAAVNSEEAKKDYINNVYSISTTHYQRITKALETFDAKDLGSIKLGQKGDQMSIDSFTGTPLLDAFKKNYSLAFKEYSDRIDDIFNSSATPDIKESQAMAAGERLLSRMYEPLINNGKDVFVNAGESITLFASKEGHISKKDNLINGVLESFQKRLSDSQILSPDRVQELKPFYEDSLKQKESLLKDKTFELENMYNEYAAQEDALPLEVEINELKASIQSDKVSLKLLNNEEITAKDIEYIPEATRQGALDAINGAKNPALKMQAKLYQDFKADITQTSMDIDAQSQPLVNKMKGALGLGGGNVGVNKEEYDAALTQMSDCWAKGSQNLQTVISKHTNFAHSLESSIKFDNTKAAEKFKGELESALKEKFPQLFNQDGSCKITELVSYGNDPQQQAAKVYVYPQMIRSLETRQQVTEFLKDFKSENVSVDYFSGPLEGISNKCMSNIKKELQEAFKNSEVEHPISLKPEVNSNALKSGVLRVEAPTGFADGLNAIAGYGSFESTTDIKPGEVPLEKLQNFTAKHQGNPNTNMTLTSRTISKDKLERFGGIDKLRSYLNGQTSQIENRTGREAVSYAVTKEDNGSVKVWCTSTYSNWIEKQLLSQNLLNKTADITNAGIIPDVGISS